MPRALRSYPPDRSVVRPPGAALSFLVASLPGVAIALSLLLQPDGFGTDWGRVSWVPIAVALAFLPLGILLSGIVASAKRWRLLPGRVWSREWLRRAWALADGGSPPATCEEAARRLAGRTDGVAVYLRASALVRLACLAELDEVLAAWSPTDPVGMAWQARVTCRLAWLRGGADDLSGAEAAALAIPDAADRRAETFWNLSERALRDAAAGRDGFPALIAATAAVSPLAGPAALELARLRRQAALRLAAPPVLGSASSLALLVLAGPGPAIVVALFGSALIAPVWRRLARHVSPSAGEGARAD